MASTVDTVFWPFAIVIGLSFLVATLAIISQAERDVRFHTSEQISHTAARSVIYTFLNSMHNGPAKRAPTSAYRSISVCYSGKDRHMDRRLFNNVENVPDILKWVRVNATKEPLAGGCGPVKRKVGEVGTRGSASLPPNTPYLYKVSIPVRGGDVINATIEYEVDKGAIS